MSKNEKTQDDGWGELAPANYDGPEVNVVPTIRMMPQGAGFELKIGDEKTQIGSEFLGSIVHQHPSLKKYATSKLGGSPPVCVSVDGATGQGNPGGECAACPWNYVNAEKAVIQQKLTCQKHHMLYVIRAGREGAGPEAVQVPVKSLTALGVYMKNLQIEGHHPARVLTRFTIKVENGDNGPYGIYQFSVGDPTPEEMRASVISASKMLPGSERRSLPPASFDGPRLLPASAGAQGGGAPAQGASSWVTTPAGT
jgi:hypothetical protein